MSSVPYNYHLSELILLALNHYLHQHLSFLPFLLGVWRETMSLMVIRVLKQYLLLLNPSTKHQSIEDDPPVYLEYQKIAYIEREIYIRI